MQAKLLGGALAIAMLVASVSLHARAQSAAASSETVHVGRAAGDALPL